MNILMQVGLTYIVGQGVLVEGNAWRYSLVGVDVGDQLEQGQVSTDASQEVSFLSSNALAWRADPDPMNHLIEEVEQEVGLHRTNEHDTLAVIEELENKLEEDEASVQVLKARKKHAKQ